MGIDELEIKEFVHDKDILFLGNGEHSEEGLDRYNIVIRCNYGILGKYADIWVNNLIQFHNRNWTWDKVDFKYMLRLNAEDHEVKLMRGYPCRYEDKTYFWNGVEYAAMARSVGCMQPFTGTSALHWLCTHTEPKSINVRGMDFFKNKVPAGIHKPHLDRAYVHKLAEAYPIILE